MKYINYVKLFFLYSVQLLVAKARSEGKLSARVLME